MFQIMVQRPTNYYCKQKNKYKEDIFVGFNRYIMDALKYLIKSKTQ